MEGKKILPGEVFYKNGQMYVKTKDGYREPYRFEAQALEAGEKERLNIERCAAEWGIQPQSLPTRLWRLFVIGLAIYFFLHSVAAPIEDEYKMFGVFASMFLHWWLWNETDYWNAFKTEKEEIEYLVKKRTPR